VEHQLRHPPHHRVGAVGGFAGAFVVAAGDHAEELGFELGHLAVEDRPARFEQVGDGLGAGGLGEAGVDHADAQGGVGGVEHGLDHLAALVGLGDDFVRAVRLGGGGDGAGPAFGPAGDYAVIGEDVGDGGVACPFAGAGDYAARAVADGGIDGD